MANEGFEEEWDADFVDQLVQAEELALSSATQHPLPPPPPHPPHTAVSYADVSYSPPRGFNDVDLFDAAAAAGRTTLPTRVSHTAREQEIDSLKRELDRVLKQRTLLEQECIDLRKERDKKEKGLKLAFSRSVNFNTDSAINIPGDGNACSMNDHIGSRTKVGRISSKDVGIQTEKHDESISFLAESHLSASFCRRNKLLDAWNSSAGQRLGRLLVSKLYATCEADLRALSGYLNVNFPLRTRMGSNVSLEDNLQYTHSGESAKVSHIFSVLTKITDEMVRLEELVDALVGLCKLENVAIIYPSLHILQEVLSFTFSMERKFGKRENIVTEEPACRKNAPVIYEYGHPGTRGPPHDHAEKIFDQHYVSEGLELDAIETCASVWNRCIIPKYFKTIEEGSSLACKEESCASSSYASKLCFMMGDGDTADTNSNNTTFPVVIVIFESLADCVTCTGNNAEELQLRRHTIILLAFFASSGKSGIEILLNYRLPKGNNFLTIILQSLVCDVDLEESDTAQLPEIFKERTLLIREVLILLNRLVSHPRYSSHVLRALTNSRGLASLTVDVTSRLSSKRKFLWQDVSMMRQIRESEIIDLAQVLRRRVFTFLGGSSQ